MEPKKYTAIGAVLRGYFLQTLRVSTLQSSSFTIEIAHLRIDILRIPIHSADIMRDSHGQT
jgi:hypothetical protein